MWMWKMRKKGEAALRDSLFVNVRGDGCASQDSALGFFSFCFFFFFNPRNPFGKKLGIYSTNYTPKAKEVYFCSPAGRQRNCCLLLQFHWLLSVASKMARLPAMGGGGGGDRCNPHSASCLISLCLTHWTRRSVALCSKGLASLSECLPNTNVHKRSLFTTMTSSQVCIMEHFDCPCMEGLQPRQGEKKRKIKFHLCHDDR